MCIRDRARTSNPSSKRSARPKDTRLILRDLRSGQPDVYKRQDPDDWLTPFDVAMDFPGVGMIFVYSRSHMKPKGKRGPRPRFHVYFIMINIDQDHQQYCRQDGYPYK